MIFVIGSGYIGSRVLAALSRAGHGARTVTRQECAYLVALMKLHRPELVINAAGYIGRPNVDACDKNPVPLMSDNVIMPTRAGYICEAFNVPILHFSSGCIYEYRNGSAPWTEDDEPNFRGSLYSLSKLLGEEALKPVSKKYVCRIRLPFSSDDDPRNLLVKLRTYPVLLEAENSISNVDESVNAAIRLWECGAPFGTYNVVNTGPVWTREIAEMLGIEPQWELWSDFYARGHAKRSNCVLSNDKLSQYVKMRPVREALEESIEQLEVFA